MTVIYLLMQRMDQAAPSAGQTLRRWRVAILCSWMFFMPPVAHADALGELQFITENYAPFNYQKDGKIQGTSVDLLLKIFKQAGTDRGPQDIEVMNWARGYKLAQSDVNTVLFSTTRTKSRENLFKWVGPIAPTRVAIIGKKDSSIEINSDADLKKYRIGAVRDDIGELLLLGKGIGPENIYRTNSSKNTTKMLMAGRIDLWAYESSVALFNLKEHGESPDDYEMFQILEESHLYFAIQKDTSDHLVDKLQDALDKVREMEK